MNTDIPLLDIDIDRFRFLLSRYRKGEFNQEFSNRLVVFDPQGFDGFSAFQIERLNGQPVKTKHPRVLQALNAAEHNLNIWINIIANDYVNGLISFKDLDKQLKEKNYPSWVGILIHKRKREIWGDTY